IGSQVWFAQNLRYDLSKKTNNPTDIQYDPEDVDNPGILYKRNAFLQFKLCPEGWHIPKEEDWNQLSEYLGGYREAGGKLKSNVSSAWNETNIKASNHSGCSAFGRSAHEYRMKNILERPQNREQVSFLGIYHPPADHEVWTIP